MEFCRNYLEKRKQSAEKKEAAAKAKKEAAEKKESATKKRIVTLWKNGHLPKFKKSLSGKQYRDDFTGGWSEKIALFNARTGEYLADGKIKTFFVA